jgi:hypothetical protein
MPTRYMAIGTINATRNRKLKSGLGTGPPLCSQHNVACGNARAAPGMVLLPEMLEISIIQRYGGPAPAESFAAMRKISQAGLAWR